MKAEILNTCDQRVIADIRRMVREVSREFQPGPVVVNVILTNDRGIGKLNRQFLRRDRPTDVLAFPLGTRDPDSRKKLLGEVYVSRDRAHGQAREYGVSYHDEIRRLVLHGLLHLLGLNHQQMKQREDRRK